MKKNALFFLIPFLFSCSTTSVYLENPDVISEDENTLRQNVDDYMTYLKIKNQKGPLDKDFILLSKRVIKKIVKDEKKPENKPDDPAPAAEAEKPAEAEKSAEEAPAEGAAEETAADGGEEKSGHGCLFGVFLLLPVLALAVVLAALWFWPHARPYALKVSDKAALVDPWADRVGSLRSKWSVGKKDAVAQAREEKKLTLGDVAQQNGLKLDRKDGKPLLSGNLKLRTERMAVRALALATDRQCQLDLTDDESLRDAADALLFLLTEGRVKVAAATNRVVELRGFAPTTADLSRLIRGLSADVPAIAKIVSTGVKTGDAMVKPLKDKVAPVALTTKKPSLQLREGFAAANGKSAGGPPAAKTLPQSEVEFSLQLQAASNAVVAANLAASNAVAAAVAASNAAASNAVAKVQAEKAEMIGKLTAKLAAAQSSEEERELKEVKAPNGTFVGLPRGKSPRNYPVIAGILTAPYPCVVLANGMRCVYGAQLGGAEIVEISADSVLLQDEDVLFAWIP